MLDSVGGRGASLLLLISWRPNVHQEVQIIFLEVKDHILPQFVGDVRQMLVELQKRSLALRESHRVSLGNHRDNWSQVAHLFEELNIELLDLVR